MIDFVKTPSGLDMVPTPEAVERCKEFLAEPDYDCERALQDMLASHLENGWYNVDPSQCGALTSAPIISEDCGIDEDGNPEFFFDMNRAPIVYAHMNYAVEDPIKTWSEGRPVHWVASEVAERREDVENYVRVLLHASSGENMARVRQCTSRWSDEELAHAKRWAINAITHLHEVEVPMCVARDLGDSIVLIK